MENITVVEMIAGLVDELAGSRSKPRRELITYVTDRPGHDRRYAIDSTKIETELGWKPEESFASGLQKTVEWYLSNAAWVNSVRTGEYQEWIRRHYG